MLEADAETRDIPVLVVTVTNREQKARALGADEFVIKPLDHQWLARKLATLARRSGPISRILVIVTIELLHVLAELRTPSRGCGEGRQEEMPALH